MAKTTEYFREQVMRKRSYLEMEWCVKVLANPVHTETQADGRIRFWGYVEALNGKALRVVTLEAEKHSIMLFPIADFLGDSYETSLLS